MSHTLIWFLLGTGFILAELATPGFIIVFFGVGAWAAALLAAFWPGLEQELGVFLLVSLFSLLLLRHRLVATFQGRSSSALQNAPAFPHAGRQAEVTKAIAAGSEGEISFGGSFWRATASTSMAVGDIVRVISPSEHDELLLLVEVFTPADNG